MKNWVYRLAAWFAGGLLWGCVVATVMVDDPVVPAGLQGKQWIWLSEALLVALPFWAAGGILNFRFTVHIVSEVAEWVLMFGGAVQALLGLGQIAGLYPSGHSLFVLTGTFYNPGPYSGYLAAILPVALYRMLSVNGRTGRRAKVEYYVSLCVVMLVLCVLTAGMSRAAWLAAFVSCGYVTFRIYGDRIKFFMLKYKYAVLGVLLSGIFLAAGAYLMKRDSADGRLLIWKITMRAIADNPMGEERGRTFSALYGDAQEEYFMEGKFSDAEAWVAGSPDFAFNEFLQIAAERGIWVAVAVVVWLLVLLGFAGKRKRLTGMGGCLVSLMVFASFSYPLHIPAIVSVWVLTVMVLMGEWLVAIRPEKLAKVVLLLAALAGLGASVSIHRVYEERVQAAREWMPLRGLYRAGDYQAAVKAYEKLYSRMNWNDDYCFEYGRALYRLKCYEKAEEELKRALTVSGDPMILNLLGRNAQDKGEFEKAEEFLIRSTHRLPERIYPYYLLVKLYAVPEYYSREKLVRAAEKVLYSEPKVNSTAVREMRQEVRSILNERK